MSLILPSNAFCSEASPVIGIEGLPGAGKTTILAALAEELEGKAVFLSEVNFEPRSPYRKFPMRDQRDIYLRFWIERMALLKTIKDPSICFLSDRTYFSNFAYIYALDALQGTHSYHNQLKLLINNLLDIPFHKLFVFDIHPEIGQKRRRLRGDQIPWPWSEEKFLTALHQFYKKELPQFGKVHFIDTLEDKKSITSNLKTEILKSLNPALESVLSYTPPNENQEKALSYFARRNELGAPITRILNVLGTPTLYFLKHSLQLVDGWPTFFNNEQLYRLLKNYKKENSCQNQPYSQERTIGL